MNWWRLYIVCRLRNYLRWNLNQNTTVLLQEIAFRNDYFHGNPCSFRLGPIRTISVIVSNHNGTYRDYTKWFWFHFAYRSRWIKNTTLDTVVQLKRKKRFIDEFSITGYQNMNLSNQGWNIVKMATFLFDFNAAFFLKAGPLNISFSLIFGVVYLGVQTWRFEQRVGHSAVRVIQGEIICQQWSRVYIKHCCYSCQKELTFRRWNQGIPSTAWTIPRWLMPWLLASPGHQPPWYCLCETGRSLSYRGKNYNYPHHHNIKKW